MFFKCFLRGQQHHFKFFLPSFECEPWRVFWIVIDGRYRIVGKNVLNNSQDIVVTWGITASVANIAAENVLMKEEPITVSHNLKFFVSIMQSSFINLCDSFDKDNLSPPDVVVPISMNL